MVLISFPLKNPEGRAAWNPTLSDIFIYLAAGVPKNYLWNGASFTSEARRSMTLQDGKLALFIS